MQVTVTREGKRSGKTEKFTVTTPFGVFERETQRVGNYQYLVVASHDDGNWEYIDGRCRFIPNGEKGYRGCFSSSLENAFKTGSQYGGTPEIVVDLTDGTVRWQRTAPERPSAEVRKLARDRKQGRFPAVVVRYLSQADFECDRDFEVVEKQRPGLYPGQPTRQHSAYSALQQARDLADNLSWDSGRVTLSVSAVKAQDWTADDPYLRRGYRVRDRESRTVLAIFAAREA